MKVTFLNVGQGDSIVIEWKDNEKRKIGVIDCKAVGRTNPTIDYLKKIGAESLEFIILTHPHSDHFSGLRGLIDYLSGESIMVKYFMHTGSISPNSIKTAVKGGDLRNEIGQLFWLIHTLKSQGFIQKVISLNEMAYPGELNDEWKFLAISPSVHELDKYSVSAKYNLIDQDEEFENEKSANLLGTMLLFFSDTCYYLLTSDCVIDVFNRVDNHSDYKDMLNNRKLLFGQIPHHGSSKNFKNSFWRNRNLDSERIPAVISVGKNKYKHPHDVVLRSLSKLGYNIHTTEPLENFTDTTYHNKLFMDMISVFHRPQDSGFSFFVDNDTALFEKLTL